MTKVAVIGGKGRMGSRHCRTLQEMGIEYECFDMKDCKYVIDVDTRDFTHFIISTLSIYHAEDIRVLRRTTDKPILVEKPVITSKDDLDILEDKNIFHGVIRRFDSMTHFIQKWCITEECYYVSIYKTLPLPINAGDFGSVNLDVNIHHIDALLQMYPDMKFTSGNVIHGISERAMAHIAGYYNTNNMANDVATFYGKNGNYIIANFNARMINVDYRYITFPVLPLREELTAFLEGKKCYANEATKICLDL